MRNTAITDPPASVSQPETLKQTFSFIQPMLEDNRAFAIRSQTIIKTTPALREREWTKLALADALSAVLRARGAPMVRGALAAQTAMAAFVTATFAWLDDPSTGYSARIDLASQELSRFSESRADARAT